MYSSVDLNEKILDKIQNRIIIYVGNQNRTSNKGLKKKVKVRTCSNTGEGK